MNEDEAGPRLDEGLGAKPREKIVAIRRVEHRLECVHGLQCSRAAPGREQVKIVIAEDPPGSEGLQETKGAERVGTAIDEVADRLKGVLRGVELEEGEQPLQFIAASLDVADEDSPGHKDGGYTARGGR